MAQDVLLKKTAGNNLYDIQVVDGNIVSVEGLETTIVVSLFTDARAPKETVPDPLKRRGWIGNILNENLREIGGLIWLSDQSRLTDIDFNELRINTLNSLQVLIDFGIVSSIEVEVIKKDDGVYIKINFSDIDNIINEYITLWRKTSASNLSEL